MYIKGLRRTKRLAVLILGTTWIAAAPPSYAQYPGAELDSLCDELTMRPNAVKGSIPANGYASRLQLTDTYTAALTHGFRLGADRHSAISGRIGENRNYYFSVKLSPQRILWEIGSLTIGLGFTDGSGVAGMTYTRLNKQDMPSCRWSTVLVSVPPQQPWARELPPNSLGVAINNLNRQVTRQTDATWHPVPISDEGVFIPGNGAMWQAVIMTDYPLDDLLKRDLIRISQPPYPDRPPYPGFDYFLR